MTSKCYGTIFTQWPVSGCNAAYWALTIAALLFTYKYHISATALYSQLEKNSNILPSKGNCGSSGRHLPLVSLRAWRVATFLVFISQTYLAVFAFRLTYYWIHALRDWALRQENGSRPVIMQVCSPHRFFPHEKKKQPSLAFV